MEIFIWLFLILNVCFGFGTVFRFFNDMIKNTNYAVAGNSLTDLALSLIGLKLLVIAMSVLASSVLGLVIAAYRHNNR